MATFSSSSVINRMPIEKSVLKNVVILLLEKVKASHVSIVQLLAVLINLSFTQVSQSKVFSRESFRAALKNGIWHFVFDFFLSVLKQIGIFTMPFTEMENVRFTALSISIIKTRTNSSSIPYLSGRLLLSNRIELQSISKSHK